MYIIQIKTAFGEWLNVEEVSTLDEAIDKKNEYASDDTFNFYRIVEKESN